MPLMAVWRIARNRLGTNLTKWSNTFKEFIDNSLSVSDHFVGLALKRLTGILIFLSNIRLLRKYGMFLQLLQKYKVLSTYKRHISVVFHDIEKEQNKSVTCHRLTNLTHVTVSVSFQLKCDRQLR